MKLSFDDTADEEEDEEEYSTNPEDEQGDEVYKRLRLMIEGLIENGKRALETNPGDFIGSGKGGAKVLSAEEVRSWIGTDDYEHSTDEDSKKYGAELNRPVSPQKVTVPQDDSFEEEVETLAFGSDSTPSTPPPPPIRIVPST
jgi:hypothetical protein